MNHLDYLEDPIMSASEWEKFTSVTAQELVDVLRKKGCTYYDAKAALSTAFSIIELPPFRHVAAAYEVIQRYIEVVRQGDELLV